MSTQIESWEIFSVSIYVTAKLGGGHMGRGSVLKGSIVLYLSIYYVIVSICLSVVCRLSIYLVTRCAKLACF